MATHTENEGEQIHDPCLDFASLTPANLRTYRSMQKILDTIGNQSYRQQHHSKFIRSQEIQLVATRSPVLSSEYLDSSSGVTTEADQSDDEDIPVDAAACYVLSLNHDSRPFKPEAGFMFGTGDVKRFPDTGGVDLLLPPSNLTNPQSLSTSGFVYARQGYFDFGSPEHPQLWLHARHKGIRVDDRPLAPMSKILLPKRARISIGPYRYIFEYKVSNEIRFQDARKNFLAAHRGAGEPYAATSATPSLNDVRVQDWVIHGIAAATAVTVIHAATHVRSGEVVAVKRLRFGMRDREAEKEVALYDAITKSILGHEYSSFVMQMHSALSDERPHESQHEVYLLWKPLARGDFSQFGLHQKLHSQSKTVKKILFVQVLLGLKALHDSGWIHCDLKPANLGVVRLGDRPQAVIIDEGQARRLRPEGYQPQVAHCGSIAYLAPELENSDYAPRYGKEVDIWSMGAVGVYLFLLGWIPWSHSFNMFVPERELMGQTLGLFRQYKAGLLRHPRDSLDWLIGTMLEENPRERATLPQILSHASLRSVREGIDKQLDDDNTRLGTKRARPT